MERSCEPMNKNRIEAFSCSRCSLQRSWPLVGSVQMPSWPSGLAYILTRPLGAALGDLLSQAKTYGGVGLGPMLTSVIFLAVIDGLVAISQREVARRSVPTPR